MDEVGRVALEKLTQLAALVQGETPAELPGHGVETPGRALDQLLGVASSVVHCADSSSQHRPGIDVHLIEDLFDFLTRLPAGTRREIRRLEAFTPEPAAAWEESRGDRFWSLAALVQDVWEHTFGPEVHADPQILTFLSRIPLGEVLDFGSGAGYFAFRLARREVSVTCVENNLVKRQFLRHRCHRRPEARWISLRPRARRYDTVLAVNVLDHLRDPLAAVRSLARRLRPGGALICQAGFPDDGWHRGGETLRDAMFQELMRHFRYPEPATDPRDETIYLIRRAQSQGERPLAPIDPSAAAIRVQLHPAAILVPSPQAAEQFVLSVPRFYARALLLTPAGAQLARYCRRPRTVGELCDRMKGRGTAPQEVCVALDMMAQARLLLQLNE